MMKKTKVIAIAMVLMLGLGACGNSKASNTEVQKVQKVWK